MRLLRNVLLFLGIVKRQQLAVGLFTLLTVNHKCRDTAQPHYITTSNDVTLPTCQRQLFCKASKHVPHKSYAYVWRRCVCVCVCTYLYLRAICRVEQSASSLPSVILICSDSAFFRSRAAVSCSFLAFSLSMHLRW